MDRLVFAATVAAEGRTLSGVAHVFGTRTLRGQRYIQFAPGSFDAALARDDPRSFVNHDPGKVLGRRGAGTVRLDAQPDGLHYEIDVPETTYGNDLLVSVGRKDINSMSFGILPGKFSLQKAEDGKQIQLHTAVESFFDISPVSMPAFDGTSIELHSADLGDRAAATTQLIKARMSARKGN